MPYISLFDITAKARTESALVNNQVLTDQDIYGFVAEAYADLRDRLIQRFAGWFKKTQSFALAGGVGQNVFDLSTVPDFQMAQGLNLQMQPGAFYTVPVLPSFEERNNFNGTWPFVGQDWGYNGFVGRKYYVDGDDLEILPAQNAGGIYQLVYTPIETMAAPLYSQTVSLASGDDTFNHNGYQAFTISGLTSDATMLGGTLTVAFTNTPNLPFNGTYVIDPSTPIGGHVFYTTTPTQKLSWTGPSTGSVDVAIPAVGTTCLLPQKLNPWVMYLILFAALQIKNSREDPAIEAISGRFQDIKQRVIDLTKQRTQSVRQAPITRNRFGTGPGWNGQGW